MPDLFRSKIEISSSTSSCERQRVVRDPLAGARGYDAEHIADVVYELFRRATLRNDRNKSAGRSTGALQDEHV